MKTVNLYPGIAPSVLGFGCAPILGSVGKEDSLRALELAWECGINYFDVAPSYGFGEAESFLGSFLAGKRDRAVIATKFGIQAHPVAKFLAPLKGAVRALKNAKGSGAPPSASETAPAPSSGGGAAAKLLRHVPITPETLRSSLDRSLSSLRTDYVDILLIHEPGTTLTQFEDVFAASRKLVDQGKIKAFGLAATLEELQSAHSSYTSKLDVLQVGIPSQGGEIASLEKLAGPRSSILYGAVKGKRFFSSDEMSVSQTLLKVSDLFPNSVILCSMFKERHLRDNCSVFQ